ncbi:hypothetical protein C8J56DRAFT_1072596 [Mycena floridula]|nr:hypothetical protein C8J56DRAFT_1072596 [Mycena floridula]
MTKGSEQNKAEGVTDQFIGSGKQMLGNAVGNHSLENKGQAQNTSGHAREQTGKTQGYVAGVVDTVTGTLKNVAGAVVGDNSQQVEGKAQQTSGDAKRTANS